MKTLHPNLHLGTSSWSSKDWEGVFYPPGTAPGDYLAHYATRYQTVEVDATFYRTPSIPMVRKWREVLPEAFLLAAKVPQVITHEKTLADCGEELHGFLLRPMARGSQGDRGADEKLGQGDHRSIARDARVGAGDSLAS